MFSTARLELTGPQFRPLREAIEATFRLDQFDMMLQDYLSVNRESIALGNNFKSIINLVIDDANRKGWVYKLVNAARQERPDYPVFVEYARLVGMGPQGMPDPAQLEGIVRKSNAQLDIAEFRSRIGEIEGRVCRVDINGTGAGTGFLVGSRYVMTNYHVIEGLYKDQFSLNELSCRFDYKARETGTIVQAGTITSVKDVLIRSEYDQVADFQSEGLEPDPEKLDFAVLVIDKELGEEPISDKTKNADTPLRGWIKLSSKPYDFAPRTPLFIVQHPDAKPMKLALDTEAVIGLNSSKTRVKYTTNTEPGSSGSPCFNQNWELVALHHAGDPKWGPTWNRGIPIALIADYIKQGEYKNLVEQ